MRMNTETILSSALWSGTETGILHFSVSFASFLTGVLIKSTNGELDSGMQNYKSLPSCPLVPPPPSTLICETVGSNYHISDISRVNLPSGDQATALGAAHPCSIFGNIATSRNRATCILDKCSTTELHFLSAYMLLISELLKNLHLSFKFSNMCVTNSLCD